MDPKLWDKLAVEARKKEISTSEYIRNILEESLKEEIGTSDDLRKDVDDLTKKMSGLMKKMDHFETKFLKKYDLTEKIFEKGSWEKLAVQLAKYEIKEKKRSA